MRLAALLSGVALAALLASGPALAESVSDAGVKRNTQKTIDQMEKLIDELDAIKSVAEDMGRSIGGTDANKRLSDLPGWEDFKDGGVLAATLKDFAPDTCGLVACQGGGGGEEADLSRPGAAVDWARRSFYANQAPDRAGRADLVEIRLRAGREAGIAAYGLALDTRNFLQRAQERAAKLEEMVDGATDLRGDVRANTALRLAEYQQTDRAIALLTSLVEMRAAQRIATDATMVAEGGSAPPDVRDDADYDLNGARRSVTKSDSGASTGGDAFDAMTGAGAPTSAVTGPDATGAPVEAQQKPPATPASSPPVPDAPSAPTPRPETGPATATPPSPEPARSPADYIQAKGDLGDEIAQARNSLTMTREVGVAALRTQNPAVADSIKRQHDAAAARWKEAEAQALNSGDPSLVRFVRYAEMQAATLDMDGKLLSAAETMAKESGRPEDYQSVQKIKDDYRSGKIGSDDYAQHLTGQMLRMSGSSAADRVADTLR